MSLAGATRARFCTACGASLPRRASFCGHCGRPAPAAARVARGAADAAWHRWRRATAAIATVFAGTLLLLVVSEPAAVETAWIILAGEVLLGLLAGVILGPRALRASFGRAPSAAALLLAAGVACATLVVAMLWVWLVHAAALEVETAAGESAGAEAVVTDVLAAPLLEEWLCRGMLWIAVRPLTRRGAAILVTALCFSLLHGLNGLYLFELPHRFVLGLLLGWLRDRTGSLWPCVLAHALHNGAALALDG